MTINMTISIVSHGDSVSVNQMLMSSSYLLDSEYIEIIIRENLEDSCNLLDKLGSHKNVKVFYNEKKYGFGSNHNKNFQEAAESSAYFIVCNPDLARVPDLRDVKLSKDLLYLGTANICNIDGTKSDFCRSQINFKVLLQRFLGFKAGIVGDHDEICWCPSVFKIFSRALYRELKGYDEKIFMYYEDYDVCMRAALVCSIHVHEELDVFHVGRRSSRRNIKLLIQHLKSITYVIFKHRNIVKFFSW